MIAPGAHACRRCGHVVAAADLTERELKTGGRVLLCAPCAATWTRLGVRIR